MGKEMHDASNAEGAFDELVVLFADRREHVEKWLTQAESAFPKIKVSLAVVKLLEMEKQCRIPNEEIAAIGWLVEVMEALRRIHGSLGVSRQDLVFSNILNSELIIPVRIRYCNKWSTLSRSVTANYSNVLMIIKENYLQP